MTRKLFLIYVLCHKKKVHGNKFRGSIARVTEGLCLFGGKKKLYRHSHLKMFQFKEIDTHIYLYSNLNIIYLKLR